MHLPRHTIESHAAVPLFNHASFSTFQQPPSQATLSSSSSWQQPPSSNNNLASPCVFACATSTGFFVAQSDPLKVVTRRTWASSQGGLSHVSTVQHTSLLVLVGGGRVPRFAPNKVILWDEAAEYQPPLIADDDDDENNDDASTIFSAGSKFDSSSQLSTSLLGSSRSISPSLEQDVVDLLGHSESQDSIGIQDGGQDVADLQDDGQDWQLDSPNSPPDSLCFSHSSLVHAESNRPSDQSVHLCDSQGGNALLDLEYKAATCNLQSSAHLSASMSDSPTSLAASSVSFDLRNMPSASLASSAAIVASSANLDDPFAADDNLTSSPTSPPPSNVQSTSQSHLFTEQHPSSVGAASSSGSSFYSSRSMQQTSQTSEIRSPTTSTATSHVSSSPSPATSFPQTDLDRKSHSKPPETSGASVYAWSTSSTHSNATHRRSAQPAPSPIKGRQVAELEFTEQVRGIRVTSFPLSSSASVSEKQPTASQAQGQAIHVLLVVLLNSKAIFFSLFQPSEGASWNIVKRISVDTYRNIRGLGSVAAVGESVVSSGSHRTKRNSAGNRQSGNGSLTAIVAVPGRQKGHVQIIRLKIAPAGQSTASSSSTSAGHFGKSFSHSPFFPSSSSSSAATGASAIIVAHESTVAAICLSPSGGLLATASNKGTLIRVWSTTTDSQSSASLMPFSSLSSSSRSAGRTGFGAVLVRELRRGTDPAAILALSFTPDASLLAAASDKGTVHIFQLEQLDRSSSSPSSSHPSNLSSSSSPKSKSNSNPASNSSRQYLPQLTNHIPSSLLPHYFKSEWSIAQFRIPLKSFGSSVTDRSFLSGSNKRNSFSAFSNTTHHNAHSNETTQHSTDGAWAAMKGRIADIRRGEAGIDESIFLTWIQPAVLGHDGDGGVDAARESKSEKATSFRLLAITTSGAWYKIALDDLNQHQQQSQQEEPISSPSSSTVLDMYRNDAFPSVSSKQSEGTAPFSSSKKKDKNAVNCRLEEYRHISSALDDGWQL